MLLAQITDTHVLDPASDETRYVDNNGRLAEAVARLNQESPTPDAVLATGDLVNWGHVAEYEQLGEILSDLDHRLLPLPGNHDDRTQLRATFPHAPWADTSHASWTTTIDNITVIGLDSTVPGEPGAAFDDERERWLVDALGSANTTTVLALHHPPFASGITWMDNAGFVGLDRLTRVLADSTVDRIVCGHLHRPISSVIAGIPAQVGISTVQHVGLDLNKDAPISLINDPAGYLLHHFRDDTWVTHTRYIATGEDPYVPDWA